MSSSQKSNLIPPQELYIEWGKDDRYWDLPPNKGEPAQLKNVCWLEVTGSRRVESGKTYEVGFQVSMTDDAFGWDGVPVSILAKIGEKGKYAFRRAALDEPRTQPFEIPEQRITITASQDDTLYFGMYETWDLWWKGGLIIDGAFVREAI